MHAGMLSIFDAVILNATACNVKLTGSQMQVLAELPEEPQEGVVDG